MPLSSPSALDAYASSYRDPFAAVTFPGGDRVAEIRKLGRTARLGLLESSVLREPSRIRV